MTAAQISKKHFAIAKTRVARWLDTTQHSAELRLKVLSGLDLISKELPARRDWFEVYTVALDGSSGIDVLIESKGFRAFQCRDCVAITTIVPSWANGWSKILKDEEVYQILTWLLHYARQYIHRSYVASVLMMLWESNQRVLHPFGSRAIKNYYGQVRPFESAESALAEAQTSAIAVWGSSACSTEGVVASNSPWLRRNTLDPLLHQAIFYFLRAQSLRAANFEMESVVAFDCALQAIARFVRDRFHFPNEPSLDETFRNLGLPAQLRRAAEYSRFLRNNFGAHAGGWRWWDQAEFFEDGALSELADLVQLALAAAADVEPRIRSVDPSPLEWGEWLFKHLEMLWDAVWFERVDEWDRKVANRSPFLP
ncbi:hypothetical protein [Bradyrhizobium sp. WSM471]|uniref:hypothetical protein n=1 Tax=Bradyrhizobium sp. WSM471 TaxID=319017 RepID=UPI00024D2FF1|nr:MULTISPECIES: hypothetical protein [Bradyrhizobium]EHR05712.1 hypothetical protein Bra471DRAFT_06540 [Bradyrhizobium sp. WSM471]UFW40804.1 hypothetical protein BcanWSM471_32095 [Bradyrhizobium canariense]